MSSWLQKLTTGQTNDGWVDRWRGGWLHGWMGRWVDGCSAVSKERVYFKLVLYWSHYHSLFRPHSFLICPKIFLQVLKDTVKTQYLGPVPLHGERRLYFCLAENLFTEPESHFRPHPVQCHDWQMRKGAIKDETLYLKLRCWLDTKQ